MITIECEEDKNSPITIREFMRRGEYDQGDIALISYDELYDLLLSLNMTEQQLKYL